MRRVLPLRFVLLVVALLWEAWMPGASGAQEALCSFANVGRIEQVIESGDSIILLHDPFVVQCPDGEELRANSGRLNRTLRDLYLLGNVFFQDSLQTLTSNEATYNPDTGRLWARGDVVYSDRAEGTTLRGPELEYLRQMETRPVAQMIATQRPTLTMPPGEDAESAEPLELTSDRVEMIGEDELSAFGDVVITRSDLRATSGEARYNSATEELALRNNAVLVSEEFELRGDSVDARLIEGKIDFLHSRIGASLQGEDLRVTGDDLQLDFENDLLQRVVARVRLESGTRALALSATFQLQADSLDALFVDQRIDEVHAIGNALGESVDTTATGSSPSELAEADVPAVAMEEQPELVEADQAAAAPVMAAGAADVLARDWIRGDTIIGYFVPVEATAEQVTIDPLDPDEIDADDLAAGPLPGDDPDGSADAAVPPAAADTLGGTEGEQASREAVELRRLVAIGGAQSLYRMRAQDQPDVEGAQNVNFLVGQRIELEVGEGELQVATVEGLQYGVYLEALDEAADPEAEDDVDEEEDPVDPVEEAVPPNIGGA